MPESIKETNPERPRHELLKELKEARERLRNKALNGKIFDESKERIRISWMQTWIKAIQAEASILKDVEVDELARELKEVKKIVKESQKHKRTRYDENEPLEVII